MGKRKNRKGDEVTLGMPKGLRSALELFALQTGVSLSEIGRQALIDYISGKIAKGGKKHSKVKKALDSVPKKEEAA